MPAREDNSNSPIIYLAGGPGDSASADIDWWLNTTLRDAHDIILVDQRGGGLSRPSLNCPEFDASDAADRVTRCRERLLAAGVNLSAYNAELMAQDIADLILAMGLNQVNIYARSYGARLALLLAHKLPQRVRALVLDSAYTGRYSALEGAAANAWRSLQLLFADCRADDACRAAYPNLPLQFTRAVASLNAQPLEIDEISAKASLQLNGDSFVLLMREMLADSSLLPHVPAVIAAVVKKDNEFLDLVAATLFARDTPGPDAHSEGLYYSALCADEAALADAANIDARVEGMPSAFLPLVASARGFLADCEDWIDTGERIIVEPPLPDAPTLYLVGAYDPVTPAPRALTEPPLAWRLDFSNLGHGVLAHEPCAEAVTVAFLADPTQLPSARCLQGLRPPDFYIRQDG